MGPDVNTLKEQPGCSDSEDLLTFDEFSTTLLTFSETVLPSSATVCLPNNGEETSLAHNTSGDAVLLTSSSKHTTSSSSSLSSSNHSSTSFNPPTGPKGFVLEPVKAKARVKLPQAKARVKLPPATHHNNVSSPLQPLLGRGSQNRKYRQRHSMERVQDDRLRFWQNEAAGQREGTADSQSDQPYEPGFQSPRHKSQTSSSLSKSTSAFEEFTVVNNSAVTHHKQAHNQDPSPGHLPLNGSHVTSAHNNFAQQRGTNKHHRPMGNSVSSPSRNKYRNHNVQEDWRQWVELRIKVVNIPPHVSIEDLHRSFKGEGNVARIEIFEDDRGSRDGKARVTFSPPPANPFWNYRQWDLSLPKGFPVIVGLYLDDRPRPLFHPSPVDPMRRYPELMTLQAESIDFGIMVDESTMMCMTTICRSKKAGISFQQNMKYCEINTKFQLRIRDQRKRQGDELIKGFGKYNRDDSFRFSLPFSQLRNVRQVFAPDSKLVLLISVENPPKYFKKLDILQFDNDNRRVWYENDSWYRQTDIVYDPQQLKSVPLAFKKRTQPILDIGRWTTYLLTFDMKRNDPREFETMRRALQDYNVEITPCPGLTLLPPQKPPVWDYIDVPPPQPATLASGLSELFQDNRQVLPFDVRYQLEVCMSQGILSEYNLDRAFIERLMTTGQTEARNVLEYVANQNKRVLDPMSIFSLQVTSSSAWTKIPPYCVLLRSVTVTPASLYFNTPSVETSNRVIRNYAQHGDRFIRVKFTDEKPGGKIFSTSRQSMDEAFTRVKRTMTNGIAIGDRHYQFLAFGNAQLREHGAYFFAPLPFLSTKNMRDWMGVFSEIPVVAKCASRIGQCFSTTRAIDVKPYIKEMPDVVRKRGQSEICFTDGVGKISPFLAQMIAHELGIPQGNQEAPSVFQFRLAGCKGVLAVSPDLRAREVGIRWSQYKFPSNSTGLEIIRCSQYSCANLNRQLILVLSTLGVPDDVFVQKLKDQLSDLKLAMTDSQKALAILQKDIDANQMTLALAGMILDGFQASGEPFITSLLHLWRAWAIKSLKEKARLPVNGGALLLGCTDETETLRGHFDDDPSPPDSASIDEKSCYVPEIFVRLSRGPEGRPQVILGPMLLARNPSLHPGDIRVVCGVDIPALHHLKDVVVLPQTGDRDVASMCSGGDLDGDDFLVVWDQDLLPREWNHEPMDYTPPPAVEHEGEIITGDLTSFFVTYMKNDSLATIAHAHVANADWQEEGVKDEKCLKLAALHSMAVDFAKTGQPAQMTRDLQPRKWPHFMQKSRQPKDKTYVSRKVLGKLYDQVERVAFNPAFTAPFDWRILRAFELDPGMLETARQVKREYDSAMHRIMAQHAIKTEFEVWSTFVMSHNFGNDFKIHEQMDNVSTALKDQFRKICHSKAGGKDYEVLAPFAAAMYKVTYDETTAAIQECYQEREIGGRMQPVRQMTPTSMPLISFPWLFQDVLGKIAKSNPFEDEQADLVDMRDGTQIARDNVLSAPIKKTRIKVAFNDERGDVETAAGITHWGEILRLEFSQSAQPHNSSEAQETTHTAGDAKKERRTSTSSSSFNSLAADIASNSFKSDALMHAAAMTKSNSDDQYRNAVTISRSNSSGQESQDGQKDVMMKNGSHPSFEKQNEARISDDSTSSSWTNAELPMTTHGMAELSPSKAQSQREASPLASSMSGGRFHNGKLGANGHHSDPRGLTDVSNSLQKLNITLDATSAASTSVNGPIGPKQEKDLVKKGEEKLTKREGREGLGIESPPINDESPVESNSDDKSEEEEVFFVPKKTVHDTLADFDDSLL